MLQKAFQCKETGISIPIIKVRRSHDSLIFVIEILIPGKQSLHWNRAHAFICKDPFIDLLVVYVCLNGYADVIVTRKIMKYNYWFMAQVAKQIRIFMADCIEIVSYFVIGVVVWMNLFFYT